MDKLKLYTKTAAGVILILTIFLNDAFTQGIDIYSGAGRGFFMGLNFSLPKTTIKNAGEGALASSASSADITINAVLETGYSFSKFIGISTGIGFKAFSSAAKLSSYSINYDTIDSESDNYKRLITGSGIEEQQKASYLAIPLAVNLKIPFTESFGLTMQSGVDFLFRMNSSFTSTGLFTYEGYYPKYNVTISDVDFEGFKSDYTNKINGEPDLKAMIPDFFASGGLYLMINKKLQLTAGMTYSKTLSDIDGYETPATFKLSTMPDHLNSLMSGSSRVTAQSFGVSVGVRYYLK